MPERAYVPAEQRRIDGQLVMVALHEEPMTVGEVMDWLLVRGHIETVPCDCGDCSGVEYRGWGAPFFAIPASRVTRS